MRLNKGAKASLTKAGILLAAYLLWTLLVRFINVQPIGPNGSSVGLAAINGAVFRGLGGVLHTGLYRASGLLGYLILLLGLCTALLAVLQLVQRKSLRAVDWDLQVYVIYGASVLIIYVISTVVSINYRPVITDAAKGLELSYPSSHTLLSLGVMGAVAVQIRLRVKEKGLRKILTAAAWALAAVVILLRLLSNAHWLTDIIGGILLALVLCEAYQAAVRLRYSKF